MFDHSGMTSKSAFIKARIFGEPFHVLTFDKSLHEYYTKFFAVQSGKAERSDFHAQFRMVGNNYNMQLVQIMHKVVELTIRYENHRIGKDN